MLDLHNNNTWRSVYAPGRRLGRCYLGFCRHLLQHSGIEKRKRMYFSVVMILLFGFCYIPTCWATQIFNGKEYQSSPRNWGNIDGRELETDRLTMFEDSKGLLDQHNNNYNERNEDRSTTWKDIEGVLDQYTDLPYPAYLPHHWAEERSHHLNSTECLK